MTDQRMYWRWTASMLVALGLATAAWLRGPDPEQEIAARQAEIQQIRADRLRREQEQATVRVEFADVPEVVDAMRDGYEQSEPDLRKIEDEVIRSHQQAIAKLRSRVCRERQRQC